MSIKRSRRQAQQRRTASTTRASIDLQAPLETPVQTTRAPTVTRTRTTRKRSGSRGLYDSPEWRARSREHLRLNPDCVRCGGPAVLCDHIEPTRPDDREGVLRGPIQSMCRRCHFSKSRVEQGERGDKPKVIRQRVRFGPNGYPLPGEPHPWAK